MNYAGTKTSTDRRNTCEDGDDKKHVQKSEQRVPSYWQCQICMTTLESAEVYGHFKNHTDEEIAAFKPKKKRKI